MAHVESTCVLDDDGTPQDFTYCISFNKDLLACWDPMEKAIVPCEFGMLYKLAAYVSGYLNQQENLIQRLSEGLQDCATHTQPFWGSLTQRTRKEGGVPRGYEAAQLREGRPGRVPQQARGLRFGQKRSRKCVDLEVEGGRVGTEGGTGGWGGWIGNKGAEVMFEPARSS